MILAMALLTNIEENVMTIENILALILLMAGILLYTQDFKIGILTNFIIFSGMFVFTYVTPVLESQIFFIISLVLLVMMTLSLYMVNASASRSGFN